MLALILNVIVLIEHGIQFHSCVLKSISQCVQRSKRKKKKLMEEEEQMYFGVF